MEYVVHHHMCEECHRREAQDFWRAVVQVRQKVSLHRILECGGSGRMCVLNGCVCLGGGRVVLPCCTTPYKYPLHYSEVTTQYTCITACGNHQQYLLYFVLH